MESESEKRETLADIERDLRNRADCAERHGDRETHNDGVAMLLRSIADRIGAARKREMTEAEANALAVGGIVEAARHTPGNAAAMREAVVALLDALDSLGCDESTATLAAFVPDMADSSARCLAAFRKAKEALSAPPRQCDVGTAEEQFRRHASDCSFNKIAFCGKYSCDECALYWAQTPYAEEGAGE